MSTKILVVDDNLESLKLLTYLMNASGFRADAVESGARALAAAKAQRYDLVLADLRMPEMDGYELVRGLRKLDGYERTPIVAVTASAMVGERETILASGFDAYVSKPIDPQTFISQIQHLIPDHGDDSRR